MVTLLNFVYLKNKQIYLNFDLTQFCLVKLSVMSFADQVIRRYVHNMQV